MRLLLNKHDIYELPHELLYLQRMIAPRPLKRILAKPLWRDEHTNRRKISAPPRTVPGGNPKKDSTTDIPPHPRAPGSDRDRPPVQSLPPKACSGPRIKNREGETLRHRDPMQCRPGQKEIHCILFDSDISKFALEKNRFKASHTVTYTAKIITWAADLIFHKHDEDYFSKSLFIYARRYAIDNNFNPGPTPAEFNDYLYRMADVFRLMV